MQPDWYAGRGHRDKSPPSPDGCLTRRSYLVPDPAAAQTPTIRSSLQALATGPFWVPAWNWGYFPGAAGARLTCRGPAAPIILSWRTLKDPEVSKNSWNLRVRLLKITLRNHGRAKARKYHARNAHLDQLFDQDATGSLVIWFAHFQKCRTLFKFRVRIEIRVRILNLKYMIP